MGGWFSKCAGRPEALRTQVLIIFAINLLFFCTLQGLCLHVKVSRCRIPRVRMVELTATPEMPGERW